jgi:hypothetical protein
MRGRNKRYTVLSLSHRHVLLDTPGQIEIFTWSASGAIITDAVAGTFPTIVAYVLDTPRSAAPATFMSNMLYACRCALPHSPPVRTLTRTSAL